jgi:hypothetical protein
VVKGDNKADDEKVGLVKKTRGKWREGEEKRDGGKERRRGMEERRVTSPFLPFFHEREGRRREGEGDMDSLRVKSRINFIGCCVHAINV